MEAFATDDASNILTLSADWQVVKCLTRLAASRKKKNLHFQYFPFYFFLYFSHLYTLKKSINFSDVLKPHIEHGFVFPKVHFSAIQKKKKQQRWEHS